MADGGRRGRFITLEGPDGSGKSTQTALLARWLQASRVEAVVTREPGGTEIGEAIRGLLLQSRGVERGALTDALLFNAARAQVVAAVIRPALDAGRLVVCDRYADSSLAYQGYGGGVAIERLRRLEAVATGGLRPDLTILFDLPVEAGLARRIGGERSQWTRYETDPAFDRAFHERVRAGYLELAREDPDHWRVIDADRAPDEIASDVADVVRPALVAWGVLPVPAPTAD